MVEIPKTIFKFRYTYKMHFKSFYIIDKQCLLKKMFEQLKHEQFINSKIQLRLI